MINENETEPVIEYKIPCFINENTDIGNTSDDFETLQVLGKGGFSQVLKVKSKKNFRIYALKKIDKEAVLNKYNKKKYYDNEKYLIQKLNHPDIIKCYKIFEEGKYLYFIMEFMNNGDLNSLNKKSKFFDSPMDEGKLWYIFYRCLCGLKYLHQEGIIHRDIKLNNIFLDDDYNIKIGDFNVSCVTSEAIANNFVEDEEEKNDLISGLTAVGTGNYMAPELKAREKYDKKVDIYSLGVTFFVLCFGHFPTEVIKGKQRKVSEDLKNFIIPMLAIDPDNRPSSEDAMITAEKFFIKYYVKNTSIEAAFKCFFNFPNVITYFSNNDVANFIFSSNKELTQLSFSIIQNMKDQNKNQIAKDLYELRKLCREKGLEIKNDNLEIDPCNFIIFFIRKLNSELNEIGTIYNINNESNDEEIKRYKFLSKTYHFPSGKEHIVFKTLINCYNRTILSFISRDFFSFIITKRACCVCKTIVSNFSQLNFIPINVNILASKKGNNNISLVDAFNILNNTCIPITSEKGMVCRKCNQIIQIQECKSFYRTAKNLIILLDRGKNFENISYVDFDEKLSINNAAPDIKNPVTYNLIGIIEKINDEYISFIKINNIWISSKEKQISFYDVKKSGLVVALFYYGKNVPDIQNTDKIDLSKENLDEQIFVDKYHYQIGINNKINFSDGKFDLHDSGKDQFVGNEQVINNINEQGYGDNTLSEILNNNQYTNGHHAFNNINNNNFNNDQWGLIMNDPYFNVGNNIENNGITFNPNIGWL